MLEINNRYHRKVINIWLRFFEYKFGGLFIGKGSSLNSKLSFGNGTRVNGKIIIKGTAIIQIGKYCALGDGIKIISSNHSIETVNLQFDLNKKIGGRFIEGEKKGVIIGHNVWLGDNSIILPGVKIGNGAIVGAGSVVTKEVAPYTLVAGNPAKFIKNRFNIDLADQVDELEWWNWPIPKMKQNKDLFIIDSESKLALALKNLK